METSAPQQNSKGLPTGNAGVEPISFQEAFDRGLEQVVKQGGPSMTGRRCRYLTADARKCHIGALIPDGQYRSDIEGCGPMGVGEKIPLMAAMMQNEDERRWTFFRSLQSVHDVAAGETREGSDFWQVYRRRMATFAGEYELSTAKLDELLPEGATPTTQVGTPATETRLTE